MSRPTNLQGHSEQPQADQVRAALSVVAQPYQITLDAVSGEYVALAASFPVEEFRAATPEAALLGLVAEVMATTMRARANTLDVPPAQGSLGDTALDGARVSTQRRLGQLLRMRDEVHFLKAGEGGTTIYRFESVAEAEADVAAMARLRDFEGVQVLNMVPEDPYGGGIATEDVWDHLCARPGLPTALVAALEALVSRGAKAFYLRASVSPEDGSVDIVLEVGSETYAQSRAAVKAWREAFYGVDPRRPIVHSADFCMQSFSLEDASGD